MKYLIYKTQCYNNLPTSNPQMNAQKKKKLQDYDKQLKKFQYKNALDSALKTKNAHVIISVIEELVQRGTLDIALKNRDTVSRGLKVTLQLNISTQHK